MLKLRKSWRLAGVITFALAVMFFLTEYGSCASAKLQFSVILDKTEYLADEPVNATLLLKNTGDLSVMVNKRFYISAQEADKNQKDVYFILTSPSGENLPCKYFYETGYPKTEYFKLLAPGEEVKSENPRNLKGFFEIKEPGVYQLSAIYENVFGAEIGLDTFKDKLVSKTIKFTVVEPKK